VWLLLLVLFALGVGLVTAALMVTYRDVGTAVGALVPFLQYMSRSFTGFAGGARKLGPLLPLYYLNPMASLIQGFRWSLVGGTMPPLGFALYAALFAVGAFFLGAFCLVEWSGNSRMSSNDVAVSVRGLSKSYTIVHQARKEQSLRGAVTDRLAGRLNDRKGNLLGTSRRVLRYQFGDVVGIIVEMVRVSLHCSNPEPHYGANEW
jgi:hypothetical protein